MAGFFLWCILFVLCWPLAVLALIAYPFVWLISLPFRIIGITVHGVFALLSAILLPAGTPAARPAGDLKRTMNWQAFALM